MIYNKIELEEMGVSAEVSAFATGSGAGEWHVMLHVEPRGQSFQGQAERILAAASELTAMEELRGARCVMKRYFLSDSANQILAANDESGGCVSAIQQQPLDGSKLAVWMYLVSGMDTHTDLGGATAGHNGYEHLWWTGLCGEEGDSAQQTEQVLEEYELTLNAHGATMAGNCLRTWFFVRDVDTQYAGMVRARREHFARYGLTEKTHYVASTGIGGVPHDPRTIVQMDAYAIKGLERGQISYLHAPTHLNPTHEYGVTFERGTVVDYGDRRHVIISGTASINNKGEVMHSGDIEKQTLRTIENVEALLAEGGAGFGDVAHLIVYLRDLADYVRVRRMFAERFPLIPTVITLAPVCRPKWLIEVECVAIKVRENILYRAF